MKKVFVVYNAATDCYGMPFVSNDAHAALKAVCGVVSPKDWPTTLACSSLCEVGSYDEKLGQLVKVKKKIVADATDLLAVAVDHADNVVNALEFSIDTLQQLREFYTGYKEEIDVVDGSCIQED